MRRATMQGLTPEEYLDEQQRRLDRLDAVFGEGWLDRPMLYRAHVAPDLAKDGERDPTPYTRLGMRGRCNCNWRGRLHAIANHEAARMEALAHVATHDNRDDEVRVFGLEAIK